jgi:hypothetical protein
MLPGETIASGAPDTCPDCHTSGVLSQAACSAASSRVARKLRKAADVGRLHFRRLTTTGPTTLST